MTCFVIYVINTCSFCHCVLLTKFGNFVKAHVTHCDELITFAIFFLFFFLSTTIVVPCLICHSFFFQQYIRTLESSLQEEMARHAPLYGVGVESLSFDELEALANIHEQSLRQIKAIQQRKGSNHLLGGPSLSHIPGLFSSPPSPSMAVGPPSSQNPTSPIAPNSAGIHGNGHVNGGGGRWFNPT